MKAIITDDTLSLQAKGIYCMIRELSAADKSVSVESLADLTSSSKYIIRNAIKELRSAGYIKKVSVQTGATRGAHAIIYACAK